MPPAAGVRRQRRTSSGGLRCVGSISSSSHCDRRQIDAADPGLFHQPFVTVTPDRDALPVELGPHLSTPVDAVVLRMHPLNLDQQALVVDLALRRQPGMAK